MITGEPVQERSQAKKKRILEEAVKVFSKRGYAGTTIKDIAEEAQVSVGIIYRYYEDKHSLLIGMMEDHVQSFIEDLKERSIKANILQTYLKKYIDEDDKVKEFSPSFQAELRMMSIKDKELKSLFLKRERALRESFARSVGELVIMSSNLEYKIPIALAMIKDFNERHQGAKDQYKDYDYEKKLLVDGMVFMLNHD